MIDINALTIGEIKEIHRILNNPIAEAPAPLPPSKGLTTNMLGTKVIVRTYSAGAWYGELKEKAGNEVILRNARRLWQWWAKEGISLSAVATHGIKHDKSKIVAPVYYVWLEAIEIMPCTATAIDSLEGAPHAQAE